MQTIIAPWLSVPDGARALAFYVEAFGAEVVERMEGADGQVEVAQLSLGGAVVWLQRGAAERGSVRFVVTVADPDAAHRRAVGAGAVEVTGVHEEHGWRSGRVADPFGYDWELSRKTG